MLVVVLLATLSSLREQRQRVQRALANEAATAVWSYSALLEPRFQRLLEHVFHDALHVDDGALLSPGRARRSLPGAESVLATHNGTECGGASRMGGSRLRPHLALLL